MTFLTVKQFSEKHPAFSLGSIRWLLFKDSNFRRACCRKLGRRVLLNESDALTFIDQKREEATK